MAADRLQMAQSPAYAALSPSGRLCTVGKRFTKINKFAAAALRLLLFTGCRLREILNLQWENVDLSRGLLFLPDSKSGRKTIVLNASAVAVLNSAGKNWPLRGAWR